LRWDGSGLTVHAD
jgi:phenylacetate-CoA ligase